MTKKKTHAVAQPAPEPTIVAVKAFNADWTCRGFQFRVGETYAHSGKVVACPTAEQAARGEGGFHACENPFDVLSYYPLVDDNGEFAKFAEVIQGGKIARHTEDSKIASGTLTVKLELNLGDFVRRGIEWLIDKTIKNGPKDAVGGDAARIGSSGYAARIGSSGDAAQIGSSGDAARIGSSGDAAQIGSSGYAARIGSSGYAARIGSSGYAAQIGSSGNAARIGSSGNAARIGSSGDAARINNSGKDAVIACAGSVSRFRVGPGGCIAAPYHDGKRTRFATLYDGEQIVAGKWYRLDDAGQPVEA